MNRIIVYEHPNFKGRSKEFGFDIPDLKPFEWGDCISSIKVTGQPWVAYTSPNYSGKLLVFEEGQHNLVCDDMNDKIKSLKLITEDLKDPQITLYEHGNYEGETRVIKEGTNLCTGEFNDRVSSHKVQRGAWLLCEHGDGSGLKYLARKDECLPNYQLIECNDKLSFLRPLRPGNY